MSTCRFVVMAAMLTLAALTLDAAPASAHTVSASVATNYKSALVSVSPSIPGLELTVQQAGNKMQLVNKTGKEVDVLGYDDEPYLKVTPTAVYENLNSPATYLNTTLLGTTPVPSFASAAAQPRWHRVRSGDVAVWHDHRIHWMSTVDPPQVQGAPNQVHMLIPQWQLSLVAAGTPVTATGNLAWIPSPNPLPWLIVTLILGVATVLVVGIVRMRIATVAVLLGMVAVDFVHTLGVAWATAGTWLDKSYKFGTSFYSLFIWAAALVAAWRIATRKNDDRSAYFLVFIGACVAVICGVGAFGMITKSQLVFAYPWWIGRLSVAASIGVGVGLVVSGAMWIRAQEHHINPQDYFEVEDDELELSGVSS